MSKSTAATSTIEISEKRETLMLAMELGESGWLLGFSSAFGQKPLRRKIASRDGKALLAQVAWAKEKLGLAADVPVASCYEAGRDGFWLHRFLVVHGIENLVVDSASIEVNRRERRAKSDRIDLVALLDLLARHRAGSAKPVWSVVHVPSPEDEDRRHLHRELKLAKKDRTRVSHRIKGLLSNQGGALDLRQDLRVQLAAMRHWDGSALRPGLRQRLERTRSRDNGSRPRGIPPLRGRAPPTVPTRPRSTCEAPQSARGRPSPSLRWPRRRAPRLHRPWRRVRDRAA